MRPIQAKSICGVLRMFGLADTSFSVFLFLLSPLFLQESDGTAVARGFRFHRSTLPVSVLSLCAFASHVHVCVCRGMFLPGPPLSKPYSFDSPPPSLFLNNMCQSWRRANFPRRWRKSNWSHAQWMKEFLKLLDFSGFWHQVMWFWAEQQHWRDWEALLFLNVKWKNKLFF